MYRERSPCAVKGGDPPCSAVPVLGDPQRLECTRCKLSWRKDDKSRPACPVAVISQLARGRTVAQAQAPPIDSTYTIDCPLTGDAITAITIIASAEGTDPRRIIARAVDAFIAQYGKP